MAEFTFDAGAVPVEERSFDLVQPGTYQMVVHDTELHTNEEKNSAGIKIQYKITSDTNNGRIIFDYINTKNNSAKAVEIGQQTLANICRAVGVQSFTDTAELHGKEFSGTIRHKPGRDGEMEARVVGIDPPRMKVKPAPEDDGAGECPF